MLNQHIPREFITELLSRVDIVEIISERIKLKKNGNNYVAPCPFHNEKTPSFTVSAQKQFYYCFGCGAHGNVVSFLMQFDHMEFIPIIQNLAQRIGIEIPHTNTSANTIEKQENFAKFYNLLTEIAEYYQKQLNLTPKALNYLAKRGLSQAIIQRFKIGYAPNNWNSLNKIIQPKQHELLLATGMTIAKDNKAYDRFRDRIMFPIKNQQGKIIGFGGRGIDPSSTPKYLNSPETIIFHKGSELYGLYEAQINHNNLPYVIVVEGYMDTLALAQHNITNVAATLGTASSSKHIHKLLRHTSKLFFCFDGDTAGQKAAWRALENALPIIREDTQINFMFLPTNEDPDSYIRKNGTDSFKALMNQAIPLSEFFFKQLAENFNLNTIDAKVGFVSKAKTMLDKIPENLFKQLMLEKLATITNISAKKLQSPPKKVKTANTSYKATTIPILIEKAITYLLQKPDLAKNINSIPLKKSNVDHINLLVTLIDILRQNPNTAIGTLLTNWENQDELKILAKLAVKEVLISADSLDTEFSEIINRLLNDDYENTIQMLLSKVNNGTISAEERLKLQKMIMDAKLNR